MNRTAINGSAFNAPSSASTLSGVAHAVLALVATAAAPAMVKYGRMVGALALTGTMVGGRRTASERFSQVLAFVGTVTGSVHQKVQVAITDYLRLVFSASGVRQASLAGETDLALESTVTATTYHMERGAAQQPLILSTTVFGFDATITGAPAERTCVVSGPLREVAT